MFKKTMTKTFATFAIILFIGIISINTIITGKASMDYENIRIQSNDFGLSKLSPINDSFLNRPILDIAKSVNNTNVNPDVSEWIRVNISITNLGNGTAYNLTTVDPSFEDWAISSLNITEQSFVIVEENATVFYYYYFKPTIEGNFTVEPTNIVYYDINGTEYQAQSQRYVIISIRPLNIEVIDAELWLNIMYYSFAIIAGIGIIVLIDIIVIKRPKEVRKRKAKKGPAQQKSKKQEKRKTQKRR